MVGTFGFQEVKRLQTQASKLIRGGNYQAAKLLLEETLRKNNFDEPALYMLCGEANMLLGYMIIAEQMFKKCLQFRNYLAVAYKSLGELSIK